MQSFSTVDVTVLSVLQNWVISFERDFKIRSSKESYSLGMETYTTIYLVTFATNGSSQLLTEYW